MYLARKTIKRQTHYYIRNTYQDGPYLKSKDVFDLGTDPSIYIIYPGGTAYYFDEVIEETLSQQGLNPTSDELDSIFWEFLDPETQRVISGFQRTPNKQTADSNKSGTPIHLFDKRRIHYLRFASQDQHNLNALPQKFFKSIDGKSRDEIEQYFISQERILNQRELKTYVYTIFDLQRVSRQNVSMRNFQYITSSKMDEFFIDAVCQLNNDKDFWTGMEIADRLQEYLIKYVVMYFDNNFPSYSPFQDYLNDFRNRHRDHTPPKSMQVKKEEAVHLFETSWDVLKQMDFRSFNQLYRKLAMKHHPDQGGNEVTFIKLTQIYEGLLKKKT